MPNIFDNFAKNKRKGPLMTNNRVINEFGVPVCYETASNSTSGTIWEEMEQELKSQPTGKAEPVASDSTLHENGMVGEGLTLSKEERCTRLRIIQEELLFTLASRCNGYSNLDDIKRDFHTDTGFIPDRVAQEYGYQEFKDFFESDLVKGVYKLVPYEGQPIYVPRDCSKFKHIRNEQLISNDTIVRKEDEIEMEKLARALFPENAEQFINGKKIILKILHDLGGETKQILWQRIQEQYKRETGRDLAGEELRKMFQRDKALKILTKFFKNEVDVWDSTAPGVFYLKLKKPYNEIMEGFDEMIHAQKEAVKKYRGNKRQSHNNGGNHRAKLTMEDKFRPVNSLFAPSIDHSVFLEQSTSQNIAQPPPPTVKSAINPPNLLNDQIAREQSLPQNSDEKICVSSKAKFQIPKDVKELNTDGTKKTPQTQANIQSERVRVDWDGQSLIHYDGGDKREDVGHKQPMNANRNSSKPKEDGTKKKYTSRNMGTYTDSEEEEADNEEEDARSDVTLMGQNGRRDGQSGAEKQQRNQKMDTNLRRRAEFDDDPQEQSTNVDNNLPKTAKPVGHQKNIQKFMKEMMEQKGTTPQIQRTNPSATVVHPNEQNAVNYTSQKLNLPSMVNESSETIQPNKVTTHAYAGLSNAQTERQQVANYDTHSNVEIIRRHDDTRLVHNDIRPARELLPSVPVISVCSRPSVDIPKVFQLMEHVEELRKIANEKGFSHETRYDEGSFTFRRGDKLLIFTEFNEEKIRGSVHCAGRICNDRYFPKVDWDMFYSAILGLLSRNFGG